MQTKYQSMKTGDILLTNQISTYNNIANKPYVLKVRDMDVEDRPREKMINGGAYSLTLMELLSIILNNGNKKEDIMNMSSRIISEYGKSALTSTDLKPESLSKELNIPLVKACQVIAIGEIGRRLFSDKNKSLISIRLPEDVFEYTKDMHNLQKEHLRGLYLNTHYQIIHDEVLSIGTINTSMIHPREIFRPAIERGAAAIILVHNHPSGISTPSDQDIMVTEQLILAGKLIGINIIDHIIVSKNGYNSVPSNYNN